MASLFRPPHMGWGTGHRISSSGVGRDVRTARRAWPGIMTKEISR